MKHFFYISTFLFIQTFLLNNNIYCENSLYINSSTLQASISQNTLVPHITQNQTLIIVTILFVLTLFLFITYFIQHKKRDNKELQAKNQQIEQQKEEIAYQKQHLKKINNELKDLLLIAQKTYNAVKILNEEGKVIWINESHTELYGYSLAEIQSNKNYNPFGIKTNADIQDMINVWFGNKKPITYESEHIRKNQDNIWVQTTLTPILNKKGEVNKLIAIDTDISLLKDVEKKIRENNQNITESILYAKSIQDAIFPSIEKLKKYFPESFIFHKPKSIVSGDFYWFTKKRDKIVIVCGDSTGHGVPGAFMSLMGISFLTKIVTEKSFTRTDIVLNQIRLNIIKHLKQKEKKSVLNDGMDMSIVTIHKKNKTLTYSGAFLPVYIIRDKQVIELNPDRMGISYHSDLQNPFKSETINIMEGDWLYMFTDGFYDQFGGETGEKLKHKRFKELLIESKAKQNSEKQKNFIENSFNKWKGTNCQVDDILVMGVKIG